MVVNEKGKLSFLDFLVIILQKKWILIGGTFLFSIIGLVISLTTPKTYRATAVILAPQDKMPMGLGSILGELPINNLLKGMNFLGGSNTEQFLSILHSRRLAETVINRFGLIQYYSFHERKKFYYEDVIKAYNEAVKIDENKFDNIEIAVEDTNPDFAANVANYIVTMLDSINYEISREKASSSKRFFEERLGFIQQNLDTAQKRFTDFQMEHNFIDIEQQAKSTIEALSKIEAQKIAVDIEIAQLRNQFSPQSKQIIELQRNRSVLEERLNKYMVSGSGNLIIPLKDAPVKAVEYGLLYRNVKIQEMLYSFVTQMHEQAKFNEANNTPAIQVLEHAKIPQKKIRPKRAIICILFFFSGLILSILTIMLSSWFERESRNNSESYQKILAIKKLAFSFRSK